MVFGKKKQPTKEELIAQLKALEEAETPMETEKVTIGKKEKEEQTDPLETYLETYKQLERERMNILLTILNKK